VYDVEVRHTESTQKLRFQVLPPENVKVAEETTDFTLRDCPYFEYWEDMPISDLRQMGYDVPDDIGDDSSNSYDLEESTARDKALKSQLRNDNRSYNDPAMRYVRVRTVWIKHDYDEDGIAELQKVVIVGREILDHEPASRIPVACIVPFMNTHRHMGMSIADLTFDIQRIKTALLRSGLDAMYLSNNPRHAISRKVVIDDLLTSRPGGLVRVNSDSPDIQGHVMPLQTENTFPFAAQGLEHMDRVVEARVGVNRMFQGIDSSNINDHDRVGQLSTMAAQRVEDIARLIAHGVRDLFSIAHELIMKNNHQAEQMKIGGSWVSIDPSQWRTGRDLRITAPFAAGNKDSLLQRLLLIANIHEKALAGGLPIVDVKDTYELSLAIADAADVNGVKFFTDPATVQPKPPPPDYTAMAIEVENKKVDAEMLDEERKTAIEQEKIALDRYRAELDARVKEYQVQANAELQLALKQLEQSGKIDLEAVRAELKSKEMKRDSQSGQS
jgi:hypothetical protein